MAQNVETDPRFEQAQSAGRVHLARKRGNLQLTRDEIVGATRDRAQQCVSGQHTEFTGGKKPEEAPLSRPGHARTVTRKRPNSRGRFGRPRRATGRRYPARGHSQRRIPRYRKRSHPKREAQEEESENKNEEKMKEEHYVRRGIE